MAGQFVISLDFELMWGVRDHATKDQYGRNVLGERQAIPAMLGVFDEFNLRATWAAVGMTFAATKDELVDFSPTVRPTYEIGKLSNYSYFDEVGRNEKEDPYYFGADLIRLIKEHEGQEIGSHTFSHYYCLEPGQNFPQFAADIKAAVSIARHRGIELKSFVFPRNQWSKDYLPALHSNGIRCFRGNETSHLYEATSGKGQTPALRLMRLADHYANLTGHHGYEVQAAPSNLLETKSSRFLRPYSRKLRHLEPLRLARIKSAMTAAAKNHNDYHLWWHPHNFGQNLEANIGVLRKIASHYRYLSDHYGMQSVNMGDLA